MFSVVCDQPLNQGPSGEVICPGTLLVHERPITLNDLSMSDIGLLLSGTLVLFSIAFGIKMVYRLFFPPGRS